MGCSTGAKADPLLQKQPQTRLSVIFEPLFHASDAMMGAPGKIRTRDPLL